jgi:hypothetical protein
MLAMVRQRWTRWSEGGSGPEWVVQAYFTEGEFVREAVLMSMKEKKSNEEAKKDQRKGSAGKKKSFCSQKRDLKSGGGVQITLSFFLLPVHKIPLFY